jgi:restriction system protein
MSDEEKTPPPPPRPQVVNPGDADLIVAIDEEQRQRQAKIMMGAVAPPFVPPPRPVFVEDGSADAAAIIAANEQHRRRSFIAAMQSPSFVPPPPRPVYFADGSADAAAIIAVNEQYRRRQFNPTLFSTPFVPPAEDFAVLLSRAVIVPYKATAEGQLIWSITAPLRSIIERIMKDPSLIYQVDPRAWEEIIAATYDESGLFDEVTLTPRSGDRGRDVIAVKKGFGSVRLIESVKRHSPGTKTTAEEVQALLGVLLSDPQASKGIVSTTWEFAPMIWENPQITQYIPHRLELVNRTDLLNRFAEFTNPNKK